MNLENEEILEEKTERSKTNWSKLLKEIVIFAFIAFGIILPFRHFVAEPYLVDGRSMDPTFSTNDYLIVNKYSFKKNGLNRNSVVVFKYPEDTSKNFIKRVVGLPNETVIIKDGIITIINDKNPEGFILNSSYITHIAKGNYESKLGPEEYYVVGDNRLESFDSRFWGPLETKYILGEPFVRLYPFNKIGLFPGKI